MRRLLQVAVVGWHLFVVCCLAYLVGVLRTPRGAFFTRQVWIPVTRGVRQGNLFPFVSGRAALLFFLVTLVAAFFVLVVYLLRPQTGWLLMFGWNLLAAVHFFPLSWKVLQVGAATAMSLTFAAMAVATFLARPRLPGFR